MKEKRQENLLEVLEENLQQKNKYNSHPGTYLRINKNLRGRTLLPRISLLFVNITLLHRALTSRGIVLRLCHLLLGSNLVLYRSSEFSSCALKEYQNKGNLSSLLEN